MRSRLLLQRLFRGIGFQHARKSTRSTVNKLWGDSPSSIYLVNRETIELVVQSLQQPPDGIIFEGSPGSGLLTKALLEAGVSKLRVFVGESENEDCLQNLKSLEKQYPDVLDVCQLDITDLKKVIRKEASLVDLLKGVPLSSWTDPPPYKLFVSLSPKSEQSFLRHLFIQFIHMSGLYSCGRAEVYAFISDLEYWYLSACAADKNYNRYRYISVLYKNFYEIKHITEVTWSHFAPQLRISKPRSYKTARAILNNFDPNKTHFVCLTPKVSFIERLDPSLWPDYYFFVRQMMTKRSSYVIPYLERWIPNCGPKVIKFGVPYFTKVGDLEPDQILDLFCHYSSWPEYSESNFKTVCKNQLSVVSNE